MNNILNNYQLLTMNLDSFIKIICACHNNNKILDDKHIFADILAQKTLLNVSSILNLFVNRIQYTEENWLLLNSVEPISIWVLLRAQFENYVAFNHIFINPIDEEDKLIRYNAWQISGYKTRQSFLSKSFEIAQKYNTEKIEMQKLIDEIKNTNIFNSLNEKEQKILLKFEKNWQFIIENNKVIYKGFKDLSIRSGIDEQTYRKFYELASIIAHPSFVSVLHVKDMFGLQKNEELANDALLFSAQFLSFQIKDYCDFIPEAKNYYELLPDENRGLIKLDNSVFRNLT